MTASVTIMNVVQQGGQTFPTVCNWVDSIALAANTAASYNVDTLRTNAGLNTNEPSGTKAPMFIIFSADGPFYANFFATAVIPTTNTTNGSSAEFSPNQRYIDGSITAISFIASATTKITLSIYRP